MTRDHPPIIIICTSKNLILKNYTECVCCKTSHPKFIKIMEWDTPERYNVWKRNVSVKINQCALWNLKDNFYDYLDETMITQEIKLQNP